MAVVIKTIGDEVLDAFNMNTTVDSDYTSNISAAQTYLTKDFISRLTYANIRGTGESTFNLFKSGSNFDFDGGTPDQYQLYVIGGGRRYDYWLSPNFTVETDVDYQINASRSLTVTSQGTQDSRDTIPMTATTVNFALLMVDVFRILGTHYSRVIAQSQGSVSISPATVRQELMAQAAQWTMENQLYG